jgi:hypothetical protein
MPAKQWPGWLTSPIGPGRRSLGSCLRSSGTGLPAATCFSTHSRFWRTRWARSFGASHCATFWSHSASLPCTAASGSARSFTSGVHDSAVVPPRETSTTPIGTWAAMCTRRANVKPIAESSRAVSGVHGSQSPLRKWRPNQSLHSCNRAKPRTGAGPMPYGTVSTRIAG